MPPLTRGKKQLSKAEVDIARKLFRVRIHVERVIELIHQKYSILRSIQPVNFITCTKDEDTSPLDKVGFV